MGPAIRHQVVGEDSHCMTFGVLVSLYRLPPVPGVDLKPTGKQSNTTLEMVTVGSRLPVTLQRKCSNLVGATAE